MQLAQDLAPYSISSSVPIPAVCVCARARARARTHMRTCMCVRVYMHNGEHVEDRGQPSSAGCFSTLFETGSLHPCLC